MIIIQDISFIVLYQLYMQVIIPILYTKKLRVRNIKFSQGHTWFIFFYWCPFLLWHAWEWRFLFFHLEDIHKSTLSPIYEESTKHFLNSLTPPTKGDALKMVKDQQQEAKLLVDDQKSSLGFCSSEGQPRTKHQPTQTESTYLMTFSELGGLI